MSEIRLDVIGDPIEHSKSPYIHETVLEGLDLPHRYRKVCVKKGSLAEYIQSAMADCVLGFNLTMPHKKDIIPFLDSIHPEAQLFESVNTVKIFGGKLFGYNTDGEGMVRAMKERGFSPAGSNIAIIGGGGVSSTIALKMALEGAKTIKIFNRTLSSAQDIAKAVLQKTEKVAQGFALDFEKLPQMLSGCDILINCTPLGMTGIDHDFQDFSFLKSLESTALVYDLIYSPWETNLLKNAKELGLSTLNGAGMLVYQGLLADEIFLDVSLNFEDYKEKIETKLKNFKNL